MENVFRAQDVTIFSAKISHKVTRIIVNELMDSPLAALLCQRGRLLAIAHSNNGQWYVADTACPVHIWINISMRIVAVSH